MGSCQIIEFDLYPSCYPLLLLSQHLLQNSTMFREYDMPGTIPGTLPGCFNIHNHLMKVSVARAHVTEEETEAQRASW